MNFDKYVKVRAQEQSKMIVLPEGEEERTLQAAGIVKKENIAVPVLLGNPEIIASKAEQIGADIDGIEIIDPYTSTKAQRYADALFEIRKEKGMTKEQALELVKDPMYYGVLMVKVGDVDGLVSGAVHSTGDMLRPALQIIKTKPGTKMVTCSFLMDLPHDRFGHNGLLVYSDCVVVPNPDYEELAGIAIAAAETAKNICGIEEPKVALLSFSSKGSAKHELVTKVQKATELAKEMAPELMIDGELQFDAAIIPEIGQSKAPGSPVAGYANVLIFPDIQAGNIAYKITERLGGASSVAILQGLDKPCNDLSRGCYADDIVGVVAMTAVQAQKA